jgi:phosphatidate cytidylyltransferase
MRDLGLRIASAAALALVVLAALWAGVLPFAIIVGIVGVLVAWEWGRIVRSAGVDAILIIQAMAVAAGALLSAWSLAGLGLVLVLVAAIISALLAFGERGHMAAFGARYAGLPVVALIWFYHGAMGFPAVLFLLLVVWATDTGAYFAGRLIGGPKLLPQISPNKTWSGLAGGVIAGSLVGLLLALVRPELPTAHLLLAGAVLAGVSQAGDLLESALKREYGVKDASALIPGHGGFMDRIDGLAAAVLVAAIYAAAVDIQAPARALLGLN